MLCHVCAEDDAVDANGLCRGCLDLFAADDMPLLADGRIVTTARAGQLAPPEWDDDEPYATRPLPDAHQALHEAKLRWSRGPIEVVRDPMGRVA